MGDTTGKNVKLVLGDAENDGMLCKYAKLEGDDAGKKREAEGVQMGDETEENTRLVLGDAESYGTQCK